MSVVKSNTVQVGQSVTATNNFCLYQPSTPDGTVRLGIGNAGATSGDVLIASSTGISTPSLVVSGSTAPTNGLFLPTTNALGFATNSTERLRLDASGNLGLGVTPSGWTSTNKAIQVGAGGALIGRTDTVSAVNLGANYYYNGTNNIYIGSNYASIYAQSNGQHQFFTAPSGTAGNAISFTQAMTLDASGNLMVGQTTASARFSATSISGQYAGHFIFPSSGYGLGIYNSSGGSGVFAYFFSPNYVGQISTNGTTTSFTSASDQRLKTNITPSGSAIQSILDFPVDQFDWISSGEHQDFGGVAQKIIPIIPEMVSVPEDPEQMMGVDWSKAVPRLIRAFQELSQELESLKAKVNA